MAPDERLRSHTDRLANLLANERGTEILTELQRLAAAQRQGPAPAPRQPPAADETPAGSDVAVWHAERGEHGVALRRRAVPVPELIGWTDTAFIPPAGGASRVVLIGESSARGLDCTAVLQGQLDKARPGGYQCVNLLKTGGSVAELSRLAEQLPLVEPDVVVLVAGNDWTGPPDAPTPELLDRLAKGWRDGGYASLRRSFITEVVLPRARGLLGKLAALSERCGTQLVIMVPEFNLPGWAPPADVEVPMLPPAELARWYQLGEEAAEAVADGRWADVAPVTEQMRLLDGGTSPVPGALLARAAMAQGDGKTARDGLEGSRDALVGLGVWHTPRIVRDIQELLAAFAREHGFRCVDLRTVLASEDFPEMPAADFLYSYCHLSDAGLEKAMAAIADAVLDLEPGSVAPGPGVEPTLRAFAHLTAAVFGALFGNPPELVRPLLRAAAEADPQSTTYLAAVLDILEGAGPMWTNAGLQTLASSPLAGTLLGPQLMTTHHPPELWLLRECLGEILGRAPATVPAEVDLLATPNGPGHRPANLTAPRCYRQATSRRSALAFALDRPRAGVLQLTYRMPAAPPDSAAEVLLNDVPVGTLPTSASWAGAGFELPTRAAKPGVNWLHVRWPVPVVDWSAWQADETAALARGSALSVLPVFGELFDAWLSVRNDGQP